MITFLDDLKPLRKFFNAWMKFLSENGLKQAYSILYDIAVQ